MGGVGDRRGSSASASGVRGREGTGAGVMRMNQPPRFSMTKRREAARAGAEKV